MGHPNFPKQVAVKTERVKDKEQLAQPLKEFTPPKEAFLYNIPIKIQVETRLAKEDL